MLLWDPHTGTLLNTLEHTSVTSIAYSPDSATLASGSWDGTVRLWDVVTGTLLNTFTGHTSSVNSVAFSSNGATFASGGRDDTVRLWDAATDTLLKTLIGHTSSVNSVAYSPDSTTLASGSWDGTILLWELTPTTAPVTFNPSTFADQTFEVGIPVNVTLPIATGGTAPYTYILAPDLPAGLQFDAINPWIGGTPTISMLPTPYTYTVTDAAGQTASLRFTIEVTGSAGLDVNGDGQVTVVDLAIVALFYGTRVPVGVGSLPADVNADGVVDLLDLTAVAQGIDAAGGGINGLSLQELEAALLAAAAQAVELEAIAGAPMGFGDARPHALSSGIAYRNVAAALWDVGHLMAGDVRLVKGVTLLENLLSYLRELATIPETTTLLPNYPNPFNPETWIPYQLSDPAEVSLTIYAVNGAKVRTLALGLMPAGLYQSRTRAAYWDGRNTFGEPVASGIYFYTLTAGEFTSTRKMLIRK